MGNVTQDPCGLTECFPFEIEPIGVGPYNGFVIDGNHRFLLGDFTVTHNTYCASAWCLLDWLLDPEWTRVEVASNSEDHVKKNLFGDLVRLHASATLTLPGTVDSQSISLDKKTGQGIFILVIPGGPRPRGKAKGAKCKARPAHPVFGKWSRIRFIFDEAQEISPNVFDEIPNLFSSIGQREDETEDTEHIKVFMAANPKDEWSRYGKNCRPVGGWENHDDDLDPVVLRDRLARHPSERDEERECRCTEGNLSSTHLLARRPADHPRRRRRGFPHCRLSRLRPLPSPGHAVCGDQTRAPAAGGEGVDLRVGYPRGLGADPAFTGDNPGVANGRCGRAIGYVKPDGSRVDLPAPRWVIQVDATGVVPRGSAGFDTQDLVDGLLARALEVRAEAELTTVDRTGAGQGTYDIMRRQWEQKVGPVRMEGVRGVHYAEGASDTKIAEEDTRTGKEMYDRVASELWFALSRLLEFDCIAFGKGVSLAAIAQLGARRGGMKVGAGKRLAVEGKDVYKARTGSGSPDEADAITLLVHGFRMVIPGLIPKAKDTPAEALPVADPFEGMEVRDGAMAFGDYEGHVTLEMGKD